MITPAAALHTSPAEWQVPPWKSLLVPPAWTRRVAVPSQVIRTTPGSVPLRPPVHAWFAAADPAAAVPLGVPPEPFVPPGAAFGAGPPCEQPASTSSPSSVTAARLDRHM